MVSIQKLFENKLITFKFTTPFRKVSNRIKTLTGKLTKFKPKKIIKDAIINQ